MVRWKEKTWGQCERRKNFGASEGNKLLRAREKIGCDGRKIFDATEDKVLGWSERIDLARISVEPSR